MNHTKKEAFLINATGWAIFSICSVWFWVALCA